MRAAVQIAAPARSCPRPWDKWKEERVPCKETVVFSLSIRYNILKNWKMRKNL